MIICNARIFTASDENGIIECGFIETSGGVITAVGSMDEFSGSLDSGDVIDASGLTVYPAFVDAHCHIGICENGLGFEGDDVNETTDPSTPHLRAIDAINAADLCFTEAARAGIGTVVTGVGSANPIGGSFIALKTYGSSRIDKLIVKDPVSIKFALGENPKHVYNDRDETPVTRMATAAIIREQLWKARRYMEDMEEYERTKGTDDESSRPDLDMKCEALIPLLKRRIKAHFHCHRQDDMFTAIRIAKEFAIDYVLIHATDGHLIADELADERTQCIIGPLLADRCKPELMNQSIANAAKLHKKGVEIAICSDHPETPIQYLPVTAGIAVRGGLSREEAIRAITINPARFCDIDDRVGSIEPGKDADITAFRGEIFDITEKPEFVILGGKFVD
ncbi:MAG TPA: amidohydrolase [Ruminococcaceae bacterium]|nr:amidohydrolase [Oscillospiraceae bacterium]